MLTLNISYLIIGMAGQAVFQFFIIPDFQGAEIGSEPLFNMTGKWGSCRENLICYRKETENINE